SAHLILREVANSQTQPRPAGPHSFDCLMNKILIKVTSMVSSQLLIEGQQICWLTGRTAQRTNRSQFTGLE
ncbi:hypothetical protein DKP78_20260, partial [Enterococcus faecium]